jgi:ArsR family transcriptional regulator, arsenate/arsenite/antimonite-responsive transcriptional repressor
LKKYKGGKFMAERVDKPEDLETIGKRFIEYLQKIKEEKELYKMKAQVAKALAHESRLMMIDALYERDMCVNELTELVGADQSTVSKHLSVLKNAGIVHDRKERSNKIYYQLKVPTIQNFSLWAMHVIRGNIPTPGFHVARRMAAEQKNAEE